MPIDWTHTKAPSLDDFETIAAAAFRHLPKEFRRQTGDIVIRVAEFPDDDVIDEMELESEFDLLGLFQGVGMGQGSAVPMTGQMPNAIWLYRRPILDYWAENDETLDAIIVHVLIHEIGHHFGLSDDDIDAIEDAAG
ncbi:MAG: metallopeptidase family protein [Ancalomicrobiaceae bacterium]|nr:metallopeptidase family protein [Ancalomicrobiaceae bacterium]